MNRVMVLGGGFGGLAAAVALRSALAPEDSVVLIERRSSFVMGLRKSWALVGKGGLADGERRLDSLTSRGIEVTAGEITRIDAAGKTVDVDGLPLAGDAIVVALGAAHAPQAVPGLVDHALDIYDRDSIGRASQALRDFRGGAIAIGIFGAPYTCPPAPYELAFLVNDWMRQRGVEARVEVFTPQPMSLPVIGGAGCDVLESRLTDEGIAFYPSHQATAVEPGEVVFPEGRGRFDLLLAVPPHRCPEIVAQAGLTDGGAWVRVDPATMATRFPAVYAIGDIVEIPLANKMSLPKAGVFAEAQAKVAAAHIAAGLSGKQSDAVFEGIGYCFLEVGRGMAMEVRGNFLAQPAPAVVIGEASTARMAEKSEFESSRLRAWFGA